MEQGNTNEIELGCGHTIKSHGSSVARIHMHDWLILLLLVVIEVVLYVIGPFHRYVGKDMMTDLKYPMKDNTVPVWSVPVSIPFVFSTYTVEYQCNLCNVRKINCSNSTLKLLFYDRIEV